MGMKLSNLLHFLLEKNIGPDGPYDGLFGNYVFADERKDAPKEPNTPEEKQIAKALYMQFHGRPDALAPWIDDLLANKDDYASFLSPPKQYKKAFRTMTIPKDIFEQMFHKPTTKDMDGNVHLINGGSVGPYGNRNFFSWTLNPDIFYGLKKDWGSLFNTDWVQKKIGQDGFVVFLSANVDQNEFLLNPLKLKKTTLAGEFSYQMEVIAVGDVKLNSVSYFYYSKNTSPDMEAQLIKDAIKSVK
jgi:hypothetical protein